MTTTLLLGELTTETRAACHVRELFPGCGRPGERGPDDAFEGIIGDSRAFREVLDQVETVAATGSTVLVCGETGTGKELVTRAIHRRSGRAGGPFVRVNCAAIPPALLESELFGHERGAFTGAHTRRTGRVEQAHDGTLFLDEIGEMAPELQPKLLRVIQEREFERVGGGQTLRSNARLVVATHRNLGAMVEERTFREDLYYRLSVFPIFVPPLRDRREDIAFLAEAFVRQFASLMNKNLDALSSAVLAQLENHDWPGNIRELRNVIERAVILARGRELQVSLWEHRQRQSGAAQLAPAPTLPDALDGITRAHILAVLEKTDWVVGGPNGAAARLRMKRSTLNFRMKKLGIERASRA
jgi:transcriptional regulator with GAF, ATPase, and Fis domain